LTVSFTDSSINSPTSWNWSFGDGSFSGLQHPTHTFTHGGAYTISVTATNAKGSNTLTRPDYVVVDGAQTGVFRHSGGNWYMDYNNIGVVDRSFHFGANSDIPVIADWNADGTTDAGVFRPSNGNWYMNYFRDPIVDTAFHFGKNGDIPVVGDWNGDGTSDAGVFRPSSGTWYLDTTKTGVVYRTFQFGKNGDTAVADDWDGDGTSDAGVFRPSNGNWYLNYYNNGTVNKGFHFGTTGDSPQAGKWFTTNQVPIVPVAAFTSNIQSGTPPLTVQFTDLSTTNVRLTYAWDFNNDGTIDSTAKNPSNVFTTVGNYTVSLTVTNSAGSDTQVSTNFITVNPVPVAPVANFTATPRTGVSPLAVSFTDTSTGTVTSWRWEYQNATVGWTQFSTSTNPSTSFPTGIYDIRLTVSGVAGASNRTETGYITVSPAPVAPVADFTNMTPRQGTSPLTVTFNDQSTGSITSRLWEYQNATVSWTQFGTLTTASHTFTTGTYDIRLNVTGPGGSNTKTEDDYITAT
jgi:PKD repeat protein